MNYTDKPITHLKRLLGLSSAEEVAEIFNLKKTTADNLNTGRAAQNLTRAYQVICRLMDYVPWKVRHSFITPKKNKLDPAEKHARMIFLQEQIETLPKEMQEHADASTDILTRFTNYQKELSHLKNS